LEWFRFWGGWFPVGNNKDIQSVETARHTQAAKVDYPQSGYYFLPVP